MSVTISDPFTDTNGTALSAHAFPGGYTWTQDLVTASGDITINSNEINTTAPASGGVYYSATAIPGSADYTVRVSLDWTPAGTGQHLDIFGRESHVGVGDRYYVRFNPATPGFELWRSVSGSDTLIGSWNSAATTPATVELVMAGTSISMTADGVTRIGPITDSGVASVGRGGLAFPSSVASSTAVPQVTTFEMDAISWSGGAAVALPTLFHRYQTFSRRRR